MGAGGGAMTGVTAYYNEIDPYAAQWLRNLMAAGHIAPGDVDERSIIDVQPDDLRGYTQCHFFAGIGGWSLALRLAGVPDDARIWTGSCPCQSFSNAGQRKGFGDERHLWPVWFRLIRECRPSVVYGEQVEGAVRHGWLDLVCGDMEGEDYAIGAAVLGAHSVGAPHIRQRLWFVAQRMDNTASARCLGAVGGAEGEARLRLSGAGGATGGLAHADGERRIGKHALLREKAGERRPGDIAEIAGSRETGRPDPLDGFWRGADWLWCRDGKRRPVEPSTFPLVDWVSARVGRLRAYGNAIVPQVAAEFIRSTMP